jgi:hypothetical protein
MQKERAILTVLVLLIFLVILLKDPSTTGFVPSKSYTQGLNIDVTESQRFRLSSGEPLRFTSLMVSGDVKGKGLANVYLVAGEKRWLIFSNKHKQGREGSKITGLATSELIIEPSEKISVKEELGPGYVTTTGKFSNECAETCILESHLLGGKEAWLEVIVADNTQVHISDIIFTVEPEA